MLDSVGYYQVNRGEVAKFLPQHYDKVLEIGCAEGDFVRYLTQPSEVWGIEPNPFAAQKASLRMYKVLIGKYESLLEQIPDDYFDLIICNDVIEHMESHDFFFDLIKQKMKQGGTIVGSIPNVRYISNLYRLLVSKDWSYKDYGILDKTHLRFFTQKSFKRSIDEHGFSIECFRGLNSILQSPVKSTVHSLYRVIVLVIVIATLGYYYDTQFLQYGFRVSLR